VPATIKANEGLRPIDGRTHLQNINNNIERLTEGNWLESSIGDKLDNIVSKLDEIDSSIGNISTS
jgi:methyl-accepting chemotaxis protein